MLFSEQIKNDFPLTSNQQIYSYGLGGDFNMRPRPTFIDRASIVILSNPAATFGIPDPDLYGAELARAGSNQERAGKPAFADRDDGSFPLRNITFLACCLGSDTFPFYTLELRLQQYLDLLTPIGFPEGYQECFALNLAVRLQARLYPTAPLSQATSCPSLSQRWGN